MKRMRASTFEARCLKVMKTVHATGEPVLVTKRGAPLVKVVPAESMGGDDLLGFMRGEFRIVGDVESPLIRS